MRIFILVILAVINLSCLPTKIAPRIKEYKVKRGHKFHKELSQHYTFIFKDPKQAYDFYNYINIVYQLNYYSVDRDVQFVLSDELFAFSFREAEKTTEFVNLLPVAIDLTLEQKGYARFLESTYQSRTGHWYIIMTVFDELGNDALHPQHRKQKAVLRYLNTLRTNYLAHQNYYEVLLNKNPD